MHLEHSPAYHFLAIKLIDKLLTAADSEVPLGRAAARFARAKRNARWLKDPNGQPWGIGDSSVTLLPKTDKPEKPFRPTSSAGRRMRPFSCGYVSVRASDPSRQADGERGSALFVQGAFHSNVHKHLDDLTFELFELGLRLIIDSGAYSYEQCLERSYCLSTRAHNTVQIANASFSRHASHAYGSAIRNCREESGVFTIRAGVSHATLGANHRRKLVYKPGRWLIVYDKVSFARDDQNACQWFHLHPAAQILRHDSSGAVFRVSPQSTFSVDWSITNKVGARIVKGQTTPELQGWYSPKHKEVCPNYAISVPLIDGSAATIISVDESAIEEARAHVLTNTWEN